MPLAWACTFDSQHGPFLQSGLKHLAEQFPDLQPRGRFGCPICRSMGRAGWLEPATEAQAAGLAAYQGA